MESIAITGAGVAAASVAVLSSRRYGLVVETPGLAAELRAALCKAGAVESFELAASVAPFEVAIQVEKQSPDILFVEFACMSVSALDWIQTVCTGASAPLVVALHVEPDTAQMIAALRAGAIEFLTLPLLTLSLNAVTDSFERIAAVLESRGVQGGVRGTIIGIVSAKGGCGATTIACHLASVLPRARAKGRILVVDLDYQSSVAHQKWRVSPPLRVVDAFNSVRRLNSALWPEFVVQVCDGVDFLGGPGVGSAPPEPWRIETLFRFLTGYYGWVLVDLGRQLNPANWRFLDNIDQLYVVTAPDVLALYQTRSMLQTLTNRGFERSRLRLILNRNEVGPRDFWVESIRQMFEMEVVAAIPADHGAMANLPVDRFQFPDGSAFGKSVLKLAAQVVKLTPSALSGGVAAGPPSGKAA